MSLNSYPPAAIADCSAPIRLYSQSCMKLYTWYGYKEIAATTLGMGAYMEYELPLQVYLSPILHGSIALASSLDLSIPSCRGMPSLYMCATPLL